MSDAPETIYLKSCPWCGDTPSEITDATRVLGVFRIAHRKCVVPNFSLEAGTADGVAKKWNTRATPTLSTVTQLPEVAVLVTALKRIQRETARCRGDQSYRDACKMALMTATAALALFTEAKP